jgi:UDP-glucose-4-epimerase GalE
MNILVCGGAGYIGSHMCKRLAREGHLPVTFDNLSTGHAWAVKWGPLIRADLLDEAALASAFRNQTIDAVMHFAALSQVGESMENPGRYFRNNVTGTLNLLDAMRAANVGKLVFSSSAAVYGNPEYTPIDEAHPTRPINTYGWSKLMAERQIEEYCRAYGLRAVSLRYFNAAGADSDGEIGEAHEPETHLIPNIIKAALDPSTGPVKIFGNDYDTPDGTCVRDYVHVEDLCSAHLAALTYLSANSGCHHFNLGSACGYSVTEVIEASRVHCLSDVKASFAPRRIGDPAILVATNDTAASILQWHPETSLADSVKTAFCWHRSSLTASANPTAGVNRASSSTAR